MTSLVLILGVFVLIDAKRTLNSQGINVTLKAMSWLWCLLIVDAFIEAISLIEILLNKYGNFKECNRYTTVSYTHLTLPTIYSV